MLDSRIGNILLEWSNRNFPFVAKREGRFITLCKYNLESASPSTSGTLEWGNLTAPTYFTSFVNNKVSFVLNMKDADELFRTTSVLINSGYKITLMSGSGENGYVLTYSPSDLTCSIVG